MENAISALLGVDLESEGWKMADAKGHSLDVLRNAISMEIEGKEFFEAAAQKMKHPRAKEMFMSLVKQEQRHVDILQGELNRLSEGSGWASLKEMMESRSSYPKISVFQDKAIKRFKMRPDAGELEVLNLGIEVEKKSMDYYRTAGNETADPKAKEIFNWLVGEEGGHLTILTAEYENRTKSGFYYDNMEFSLEVM